jgi:divalent metal cation (Fe/Co/Zn/Cd) transporter
MELDEFKGAIESKRHQEILTLLKQSLENKTVENLIDLNSRMMEQFVSKLDDLSKTPIDVKVETNQDLVVKEISVLAKKLEANISDIKKNLNQKVSIDIEELKPLLEKKDWIFDVKRNSEGFIETVIAR